MVFLAYLVMLYLFLTPKPNYQYFMFVPRCTNDKSLVKIDQCTQEILQKQTPTMVFLAYLDNFNNKQLKYINKIKTKVMEK